MGHRSAWKVECSGNCVGLKRSRALLRWYYFVTFNSVPLDLVWSAAPYNGNEWQCGDCCHNVCFALVACCFCFWSHFMWSRAWRAPVWQCVYVCLCIQFLSALTQIRFTHSARRMCDFSFVQSVYVSTEPNLQITYTHFTERQENRLRAANENRAEPLNGRADHIIIPFDIFCIWARISPLFLDRQQEQTGDQRFYAVAQFAYTIISNLWALQRGGDFLICRLEFMELSLCTGMNCVLARAPACVCRAYLIFNFR